MAGIMLRSLAASLSSERTPLPFIADPLAGIGCAAWTQSGTDDRTPSVGGGKTKHLGENHRASPYPPLARSASGYGSAAGSKRLAAVALAARATQPLRRTASLQGGDSLAALQAAADDAKLADQMTRPASCRPASTFPKTPRRTRTGSPRALRPTPSFVNTLPLDVLVCPPPAPPPRCDLRLEFPTPRRIPAPVYFPEPPARSVPPVSTVAQRRRSSLAPALEAPTALVIRQVPLPSPPVNAAMKKKREPLAQRTLRRTFERTPRGAQVKVLGAHAAVRMMGAMATEAEDEAAVAASVVVVKEEQEQEKINDDVCMVDSWVELNESPVSPVLVEPPAPSHIAGGGIGADEDMEWSMIDEDECRTSA